MTLKIARQDIEEVRRALSAAYGEVIRELARSRDLGASPVRIALCRRRWSLEAMLRQIDDPEDPPPVVELVPRRRYPTPERLAA